VGGVLSPRCAILRGEGTPPTGKRRLHANSSVPQTIFIRESAFPSSSPSHWRCPRSAPPSGVIAAARTCLRLDALNAEFKHAAPEVTVTVATAPRATSSRKSNGAPYDVFLSADLDYPARW